MKRATLTVAGTVLLCVLRYASTQDRTDTVAVTSGFELHTALASPQIKLVYLANNVGHAGSDACRKPLRAIVGERRDVRS